MEFGLVFMLAGLALSFIGFIFFRQPDVPLLFFGPVWRASKYVTPKGAALWVGGSCVGLVGIAITLWVSLAHHT